MYKICVWHEKNKKFGVIKILKMVSIKFQFITSWTYSDIRTVVIHQILTRSHLKHPVIQHNVPMLIFQSLTGKYNTSNGIIK